ncbi:hypothetical protein [Paenibacillus sp. YYML68]|uniref:hypothetical protein n=1 Tax=Paenibacillus sp. YYML68 TaxID=2909250 RepID=UPI002492DDDA|nr:hypothetical protein [Paenibacillus sp. YYML68]
MLGPIRRYGWNNLRAYAEVIGETALARPVRLTVLTAFHIGLAVIFQAAGGLLPGIGVAISVLATFPIAMIAAISIKQGLLAYILSNALLLLIQPSELIIFAFTTGLLGLGLGTGIRLLKRRLLIVAFAGFILWSGIAALAYIFSYPILGPDTSTMFQLTEALSIYAFTIVYSWIWVDVVTLTLRRLQGPLSRMR